MARCIDNLAQITAFVRSLCLVNRRTIAVVASFLFPLTLETTSEAATLPSGFSETVITNGLASPTAMAFAPDGRLFVCEQNGALRVIKDGVLLPTPFVSLTVESSGERGLLGASL